MTLQERFVDAAARILTVVRGWERSSWPDGLREDFRQAVLTEAFVDFRQAVHKGKRPEDLIPAIAQQAARHVLRSRYFRESLMDRPPSLERSGALAAEDGPADVWQLLAAEDGPADVACLRVDFAEFLRGLPPRQRDAMERFGQGETFRQVAAALGTTLHAVEALRRRARLAWDRRFAEV